MAKGDSKWVAVIVVVFVFGNLDYSNGFSASGLAPFSYEEHFRFSPPNISFLFVL